MAFFHRNPLGKKPGVRFIPDGLYISSKWKALLANRRTKMTISKFENEYRRCYLFPTRKSSP